MAELVFPPIFLLPTHIEPDKLPELESQIPSLTYDVNEAEIILGKISKRERALFELRRYKVTTTEIPKPVIDVNVDDDDEPAAKHCQISTPRDDGSSTASDSDEDPGPDTGSDGKQAPSSDHQEKTQNTVSGVFPLPDEESGESLGGPGDLIRVVRFAWFTESVSEGRVLPVDKYLIYLGRKESQKPMSPPATRTADILKRAKEDAGHVSASTAINRHKRARTSTRPPALIGKTTSDDEVEQDLPPIPEFLHTMYSCQRPTPINPPNSAFIEELNKIRTVRTLEADKIGIRAYSTSMATLAAYPHLLSSVREVARLPGCGNKIAELWLEWKTSGCLPEAERLRTDPRLSVLKLFYEIWGLAEGTAREFYNKGWRDLDDVVEYGWENLSRVQQIGVKYYDEFQTKIPRAEVESIGNTILAYANKRRKGFEMVIVGGYRRGNRESGDVDVMLSNPDQSATHNFIDRLVTSLERDKFITHTLTMSTKNSERGQEPLAWKGEDRASKSGFDTLDKALVVWQDPKWDTSSNPKNPNPHRRVDIIITPWKTAGCAVLGWTGATTFERDLRRFCNAEKSFKFDSSGIRSRVDGAWIDLESGSDGRPAPDMLTAEKRVFQGLGLEWRPPEERCTG